MMKAVVRFFRIAAFFIVPNMTLKPFKHKISGALPDSTKCLSVDDTTIKNSGKERINNGISERDFGRRAVRTDS